MQSPRTADFNSIKVRLKLMKQSVFNLNTLNFNSIKVRLKHGRLCGLCFICIFQFHKGTIKTLNSIRYWLENASFQFHKGTIKTLFRVFLLIVSVIFQFHKGTIKTERFRMDSDILSNFNSIKVRLKLSKQ